MVRVSHAQIVHTYPVHCVCKAKVDAPLLLIFQACQVKAKGAVAPVTWHNHPSVPKLLPPQHTSQGMCTQSHTQQGEPEGSTSTWFLVIITVRTPLNNQLRGVRQENVLFEVVGSNATPPFPVNNPTAGIASLMITTKKNAV